jgi:FXSXX-COOH protein
MQAGWPRSAAAVSRVKLGDMSLSDDPDVHSCLIRLDHVPLNEILQRQDTALANALRRIVEETSDGPRDTVAAFQSHI